MAEKPQGLSPNFNSIISPQIPSSLILKWNYIPFKTGDTQKDASVKIYTNGATTPLLTLDANTEESMDISDRTSSFVLNGTYQWEVIVTASDNSTISSGKKTFRYRNVTLSSDLTWPTGPDTYEYIGTRAYFNDIKNNAIKILADYVNDTPEEQATLTKTQSLFSGDIVPARADYVAIEEILHFIADKEESYKEEVDDLIEDGLGAGDIHKVYEFFTNLTLVDPKEPTNVSLTFSVPTPLSILSGTAVNSGKGDLSVNVSWTPTTLTKGTCTINIGPHLSEDLSYYQFDLRVGFTDYSVVHDNLIFRKEDIDSWSGEIDVTMDHIDFEERSTTKSTYYSISTRVVDKREGASTSFLTKNTVGLVPLGVEKYTLRAKQRDLLDKKDIKRMYDIYNGPAKAYVHNINESAEGVYYYAVQLYDKNGTQSIWYYIDDDIKIDPLDPPATPKPYVKSTTQTRVDFAWNAVTTADYYEIRREFADHRVWQVTDLDTWDGGSIELNPNTTYKFSIRAGNRAGVSAWATVSPKTKPKPIANHTDSSNSTRVWRGPARILLQSGGVKNWSARWADEYDNKEIFHGEWIELRNKYESGYYVKAGTRWGENKAVIFLDWDDWQDRLKGKDILEVKFYIQRRTIAHGYPNDGRFLHVWSHNYASKGSLPSESHGPTLADHVEIKNLDWNRGEGHWVTLPDSYGEKLRDGKIKGIAFFHPNSGAAPYEYMRFDTNSFQLYIKYQ